MDGVSVASGIAGLITLALQVSGAVAAYLTAVKDKPKNIKELHEELLLLGEVLSQLQDFLRSEKLKGRSFDSNSVLQRAIGDCRRRIERIGDNMKPVEGGKIAHALDRLKWPFEQKQVLQMVDNLRRFSNTFQFAVTIEGCNVLSKTSDDAARGLKEMLDVSKKIGELSAQMGLSADDALKKAAQLEQIIALVPILTQTAEEVSEISHSVRLSELREQERRTSDILDWLAPVSSLHKHRDVQTKRTLGTGKWFLEHDDFRSWHEDAESQHDLLCVGGPGVGKSVLCSFVIDHLRERYKDQEIALAHYYCDYSEQTSQTPSHLAGCLLRQLCTSTHTVPAAVAEFYQKTRNDVRDQTWFQELMIVLRRVTATFTRCIVVIDAFDETEALHQRGGLLSVLESMRSSSTNFRILATTRPHLTNVEDKFREPMRINILADESDLRHFLGDMIKSHPDSEYIMDEKLKDEILDKLCANANGMFLLPALQIQNILDQMTKSDVKRALKNLSNTLSDVFSSTLDRIRGLSGARQDLAFKTLMWISHARRPLTVVELQHAFAIRFEDKDIDYDNLVSSRAILDSCCGLVEVDRETAIVRFVHFSLKEYLQSQDHGLFHQGHLVVTRNCLKYMSLTSTKGMPFKNRNDFVRQLESLPFLEYACLEWGHHARSVEAEKIKDLCLPLLTNSQSLLTIARVRDARTPDFRKWREKMWAWAFSGGGGISLAAAFGLTEITRMLISQDANRTLSARNMYGSTPLHEAAILGYEETAELLIAHGADILDTNKGKATPFYLAICYGRLSMAQTLLKYSRAQLDISCRDGYTALHKAADMGSEPMVAWLLREGALVAARDDREMTPLHLAGRRGHIEIGKLLILAGAPVNANSVDGLYPLDLAAMIGHTALIGYLADNGADVCHKGDEAWTPLHRAARGGHFESVALLLDRGANLMELDNKRNISLHLAVRSGNFATVAKLLNYDPAQKRKQLLHQDRHGSTPREVAFYTANYDIYKYLRATEWDLLGIELSASNKLTTAIENGAFAEVRKICIGQGGQQLDLNLPDEDGQPPLHVAVQEQQRAIAEFLISKGASIDSIGYHGWHPLHIAASQGNLDLVDLCLSHGAHIHARSSSQQTPLHKAASSKSLPVLKRLLEAGGDVKATNDRGMTALHVVANQNNLTMARLLVLEYGADVLVKDRNGQTPAKWAERSAHLALMAFLNVQERKAKAMLKTELDGGVEMSRTGSANSVGSRSGNGKGLKVQNDEDFEALNDDIAEMELW